MSFRLEYNKILTSKTVIIECISWLINVTDNNDARWKPEITFYIFSFYFRYNFTNAVARPTVLYGSETWVTTNRDMTGLEAAEMSFIRSVHKTIQNKKRSHNKRTGDLWNTRRERQIQTKLDQPS